MTTRLDPSATPGPQQSIPELFARFWRGAFISPGVGGRIAQRRRHMRYSQSELARRIGMSQTHISDIESGRYQASSHSVNKIADALQVPPEWLRGEDTDEAAA